MIKKLVCYIFGCRLMAKAYTGNTLGQDEWGRDVRMYKWEQLPFCPRCGKPNPYIKKE